MLCGEVLQLLSVPAAGGGGGAAVQLCLSVVAPNSRYVSAPRLEGRVVRPSTVVVVGWYSGPAAQRQAVTSVGHRLLVACPEAALSLAKHQIGELMNLHHKNSLSNPP